MWRSTSEVGVCTGFVDMVAEEEAEGDVPLARRPDCVSDGGG
jgi:hypothetical protein